jgi:glyoxylate utilization-related uncharacterized protein
VLGSPNANFVVMEVRAEGGSPEVGHHLVPLHVHHMDDEAIFVLEGTLHIQLGDEVKATPTGAGVFVPRGTPHTFWNPKQEPVRFLVVMAPRIFLLIQELNILPERTPEAVAKAYEKCESTVLEALAESPAEQKEQPDL